MAQDINIDFTTIERISLSSAAALSFLIWDILITLDDEVKYIWSRGLSYMGFAYLVVRYLSALAQIPLLLLGPNSYHSRTHVFSHEECQFWNIYRALVSTTLLVALNLVFMGRVHALYHEYTNFRRVIFVFFGIEVICLIIGLVLGVPNYSFDNQCLVLMHPIILRVYSSGAIGFQAILFLLTITKFIKDLKAGWGRLPLTILLVRDGTWAFLLLLGVQAAVYYIIQPPYSRLFYPWMWTICAFCGYRVLLNIRTFADSESDNRLANVATIQDSFPLPSIQSYHDTAAV